MAKKPGNLSWILSLILILFSISCASYQPVYETQQIRILDDQLSDSMAVQIITPYKTELDAEMNEVIGEFGNEMSRARPESSLGNFVCDMLVKEGSLIYGDTIDFAVYNYGGIRLDVVGEGPVTRGKIFEILPFENFAVIVNLDASAVRMLLQKIIDEKGWPIGGIRFNVKNNQPENILIQNMPFDSSRIYKVIMNDYMANGGDNLSFLTNAKVELLNITIRDLALQYIQKEFKAGRKIYSTPDGRITYE